MTDNEAGWSSVVNITAAGILGAVGVGAAAAASHGGDARNLSAIATIALAHAPALLALGLAGRGRVLQSAALLLLGGSTIFITDLGARQWLGHPLFTGAAPLGGIAMMVGWIAVAVGGLVSLKRRGRKKG